MAKFLTTKQISSQLEELIQEADKTLYLVSPYLKLSKDFQELINSRNKNEKKTIIIYGKYELTPEQLKFLTGLRHVYLKFHENLHAKCYLNDSKLIITSLNFYEYSMIHNKEIGVLFDVNNPGDQEIYSKALEHIKFIEDNSNDKPFELNSSNTMRNGKVENPVETKQQKTIEVKKDSVTKSTEKKLGKQTGYCIRTGVEIPFNIDKPFSYDAFKKWNEFGDPNYPEKFCHFSGEPSNGETSANKPIMKKNWKKAHEIHGP
jgi:phosphatidylserine/phosphatidylglycerophosphate/cardiolipin synthase-like enzyme